MQVRPQQLHPSASDNSLSSGGMAGSLMSAMPAVPSPPIVMQAQPFQSYLTSQILTQEARVSLAVLSACLLQDLKAFLCMPYSTQMKTEWFNSYNGSGGTKHIVLQYFHLLTYNKDNHHLLTYHFKELLNAIFARNIVFVCMY